MKITWAQASARRLARHGLVTPVDAGKLAEQVGVICGAHAQIMSAAEISIALRVADATRTTVREALWNVHSLIKTYGPRGTVHVLPAHEMTMWTGALSAVELVRNPVPGQKLMTPEQVEAVIAALDVVLADAEMTIDELSDAVVNEAGDWAGDLVMPAFQTMWARWRDAMSTAAHRGVMCFGPNRGSKVTYTSPRRLISGFQPGVDKRALAELLRHFLYAYGPATPQNFAQWLSTTRPQTAALFESLADELEQVDMDGVTAWVVRGDTDFPDEAPQGVRLLPYFDAYVVGCHPRDKLYPGRAAERALAGGQSGNFPVMLVDGIVAGVWHQKASGRKINITVEPLINLTAAQHRELDEQVERIGMIMEGTPHLTIGEVKVGAHA